MVRQSQTPSFSKSSRNLNYDLFCPKIPSDFSSNHSLIQTKINPYELISTTLHNNEFSPYGMSMHDLMRRNGTSAKDLRRTIILPNHHTDMCQLKISRSNYPFHDQSPVIEKWKSSSIYSKLPLPSVIESISDGVIKKLQIGK